MYILNVELQTRHLLLVGLLHFTSKLCDELERHSLYTLIGQIHLILGEFFIEIDFIHNLNYLSKLVWIHVCFSKRINVFVQYIINIAIVFRFEYKFSDSLFCLFFVHMWLVRSSEMDYQEQFKLLIFVRIAKTQYFLICFNTICIEHKNDRNENGLLRLLL